MKSRTRAGRSGGASTASREIELKLLAAEGDLPRIVGIVSSCGQVVGGPTVRRVTTRYYDTPELGLAKQGVALRLRHDGERWLLALKTAGAKPGAEPAGVAVRREWEQPLTGPALDLAALDAAGAGGWVPAELRSQLMPLFETDVERTEVLVSPADGVLIDVAVDRGRVIAGTAELPLNEAEFELREGPVQHLFDLALAVHDKVPLRIGTENKAELGMRLIGARKPAAVALTPAGLSRVMTAADAFRHLTRGATGHMLANLACTATDGDPGGIGQIREAVRRLRTALRLFADVLPADHRGRFAADSRWLSQRLAEVPHWDQLAALLGEAGEIVVMADAGHLRRDAGLAAARTLRTRRFTQFVLELARWVESDRWRRHASSKVLAEFERPVADLAPDWLDRLSARAAKAGAVAMSGGEDMAAAERWRRRLRRLRLAVEMTRGVFPSGTTQPLTEAIALRLEPLETAHALTLARRSLARLAVEFPAHAVAAQRLDIAWRAIATGEFALATRSAADPLPPVGMGGRNVVR